MHFFSTLPTILPYLGTLPFIISILLIISNITTLQPLGEVVHIVSVYGLIIAVFMSGIHWGQHLHINQRWIMPLTISSNTSAMILWVAYITLAPLYLFVLLIIHFIYMLLIDYQLYKHQVIPISYYRTRFNVTTIVALSLCIMLMII